MTAVCRPIVDNVLSKCRYFCISCRYCNALFSLLTISGWDFWNGKKNVVKIGTAWLLWHVSGDSCRHLGRSLIGTPEWPRRAPLCVCVAVFRGWQPSTGVYWYKDVIIRTRPAQRHRHGSATPRSQPCQRHQRPQATTYRTRNSGLRLSVIRSWYYNMTGSLESNRFRLYCDQHVCMSVRWHISKPRLQTLPNFLCM